MFVGHYAVSLALKSKEKKAPLGALFLGVQFLDLLFFPLAVFGVERFRLVENYTASTHFALDYMPYSHSLVAAFVWGGLAYVAFRWKMGRRRVPAAIAIAVVSHWFLDLLVHTPDLPILFDGGPKLGFGLWQYAGITFAIESVLLLAGLWMYVRASHPRTTIGRYGMPLLVVAMLLINAVNIFGPATGDSASAIAASAMVMYFGFAGVAFWLDKHRA